MKLFSNTAEAPKISVIRLASSPPVQDSAQATVFPAALSFSTTAVSRFSTSTPYTAFPSLFWSSSIIGRHMASATSLEAALAVTRSCISPVFA